MRTFGILAAAAALVAFAAPASALDLNFGLGAGGGVIRGVTLSQSGSVSAANGLKTPGIDATISGKGEGYGLGESSLKGDFTTPGYAGVNGLNASINLASGSVSTTSAQIKDSGFANSSASNLSGAATSTTGGILAGGVTLSGN